MKSRGIYLKDMTLKLQWQKTWKTKKDCLETWRSLYNFGVVPKYRSRGFDSQLMDSVTQLYITNSCNLSEKGFSSQDLSTFTWSGKICKHTRNLQANLTPKALSKPIPKNLTLIPLRASCLIPFTVSSGSTQRHGVLL